MGATSDKSMKKLLFFGELPPLSVNGVSLLNEFNIKWLKKHYSVTEIQEHASLRSHAKLSIEKFLWLLQGVFQIAGTSLVNRYQIFYFSLPTSIFGLVKSLLILLAFRILNPFAVVVTHLHRGDFQPFYHRSRWNQYLVRACFFLISTCIVLSKKEETFLAKTFPKTRFVSLKNVLPHQSERRSKKEFHQDKTLFVFISNYLLEKGVLDLLEAFKKLALQFQDIHLECYGQFSDPSLERKILEYHSNQIHIGEQILGEEKFSKLREADCFIFPSWNEGYPLVILEAMSQGAPIITTNVGYIPEILGDDYQFMVSKKSVDSLSHSISSFVRSDRRAKENLSNQLLAAFGSYSHTEYQRSLSKIFLDTIA